MFFEVVKEYDPSEKKMVELIQFYCPLCDDYVDIKETELILKGKHELCYIYNFLEHSVEYHRIKKNDLEKLIKRIKELF